MAGADGGSADIGRAAADTPSHTAASQAARNTPAPNDHAELITLVEIGRALLEAQFNEDQLCDLIYDLATQIVPTEHFQLGLFDGDRYRVKVWVADGARQPPVTITLTEGESIAGWMRTSRQPLLVHDFNAELTSLPARPRIISPNPPRSAIYIPMLAGEGVIGAISIQSHQPSAFNEGHLRLLAVMANQAASVIHNAQLYARDRRRLNDLMAVSEVGRQLTRILDLDELLNQVVELIRDRFGYYHVQIFLVERDSDRAMFKASSGHRLSEQWRAAGRSMRVGQEGIIGWVAQHGELLLANDVTAEPRYIPDDPRLLPDTRAELAAPLLIEDEVLGVLDAQSNQKDAFTQDDVFILRTLADQVAVAVSSARAYQAQREEAWVTTVLLQIAEAVSQGEGIEEVLDAAVRVTAMLAGVESCTVWLWDAEMAAFEHGASAGLKLAADEGDNSLRFLSGEWPALDRLRDEKTSAVAQLTAAAAPPVLQRLCPGDNLALLPLLNQGQVYGVLGASFIADQSPAMNERRLTMLGGIAKQVGAAVDNSRLTTAREEEAWISTVLLQVAEAVRRVQPLSATLEQVARITPPLTGVDRCAILLLDEDGVFRSHTIHALHPDLAESYRDLAIRPGDLPLLDDACRLGQPLVVDDAPSSPLVPVSWRERFGSCTLLVLPLVVADEVIGVLLADDVDATHLFSPRRVRILSGIADQTALAIENARLQAQEAERVRLGRELELAHDIQRSLLPQQIPQVTGYQIAYRWRSARGVGGDFFDFVVLAPDRLGVVIADVSDKGVPAAIYMMFARTLLRTMAFSGREPAAALIRTNELIVADSKSDMFVTAYYSLLDATNHTLTYASGGHNLAYYAPADGSPPAPLITQGIALGIIASAEIEQKSLDLALDDVVLFYTDGVTDATNPDGEMFGEERLVALLAAHRGASAEAIASAIEAAVAEFVAGEAQYDDFTLVLVKRVTPQESV